MTIIEIAVYAAVLSGAQPMICSLDDDAIVARCSNGLTAVIVGSSTVAYGNGVVVRHKGDEFPVFDNGLQSWFSSAHWLEFSNGISVRRRSIGDYEFSNGLVCRVEMPSLVDCAAQHAK
jgi:hypothetical protein